MKKHNNSGKKKSEPTSKGAKSRRQVPQDTREVLAELVGKLRGKLDRKVAAGSTREEHQRGELRPNLDRLTVGVDLGDQWSHYCILGLEGETLAEGQLRTTQEDFATFFQVLNAARVVVAVGTHSAWVQEVIRGCGHEVLVANPRLMDGSKRRKRKNDRIDAHAGPLGTGGPGVIAPDPAPQSGGAAGSSDVASSRCLGGSADRAHQHHPRLGKEYGHTVAQVFQPELRTKGRGGSCGGDARSAAALGAFGSNPEC